MTPPHVPALVWHDTLVIIDANPQALDLFRCEHEWLIDRTLIDLVALPDFKGLAAVRLLSIRDGKQLHTQKLPFRRADGSVFWGDVLTTPYEDHFDRILTDTQPLKKLLPLFQSTVTYLYEW
jgi:PAS domain S-box-containing protein